MSAATPAMTAGQPCDLPAELGDDRPSAPAMTAPLRSPARNGQVGTLLVLEQVLGLGLLAVAIAVQRVG